MSNQTAVIRQKKRIALIAHDHQKPALLEWVRFNKGTLLQHELYATGTTGRILEQELGSGITIFES
jgi:methylglyoxal synthase